MSDSFYLSNMSPQEAGLNRGIWKKLEEQFRDWSTSKGRFYVVKAGVLTSSKGNIGSNKVSVPKYYYKIAKQPGDTPRVVTRMDVKYINT